MTYVELQSAGIEFPASVVAELELAGVQIDRCESICPAGRTVGAVRLARAGEEFAGSPPSGIERETVLPLAADRADWDEVRIYRGSLWLALGTAWAELRRAAGGALPAANAGSIRSRQRPSARLILPLALIVAAVAITALVTGISGGKAHRQFVAHDHPRSDISARAVPKRSAAQRQASAPSEQADASSLHASTAKASPRASTASISAATPAASSAGGSTEASSGAIEHGVGSPAGAVQAFYEAAARHQYSAAWSLADANMRSELEGYAAFANQMSSVRSITFRRAQMLAGSRANAATVAVQTRSVHSTRTQECGGSVRTVRTTAGWHLDGISINCS